MNRSMDSRLAKLESGTDSGPPHIVWANGMSDQDMDAVTARLLDAGTVVPSSVVLFVHWKGL